MTESTNSPRRALFLVIAALGATGCASRAIPFDKMDDAQVTILKLQQAQPAAATPAAIGGLPMIPGLPPELAGLATTAVQQMEAAGFIPPGLIPGLGGGATPVAPMPTRMQPYANDAQWAIAETRPVLDEQLKEQLLDMFGDAESFNDQRANCWSPGMAFSFQSPSQPQAVDVVISFQCNQAVGYGFQWPHQASGLSMESKNTLAQIYQSMFGPIPPGA